jgi:hypothetical protein
VLHVRLTAELRQYLRLAIDASVRQRIDWGAEPRCADCGIEASEYLEGCRRCGNRRRGKLRRGTLVTV